MGEHDGWTWQGRQTHGWFGHGTKPQDGSDSVDTIGGLHQRITSLPLTVIAAMPAAKRHHVSARFEGAASGEFVRAMTGWVSAISLGEADFAARYFGTSPGRLGIEHFRNVPSIVATASSFAELREASDEVAAGIESAH